MKRGGPGFHINYDEFCLQVHVLGYRTQGESIVIFFKEGERTFYTIVIDSFCIGENPNIISRTEELLVDNGVGKISMLIMTHPHEDHILGMDALVEKYSDNNTLFYYPSRSFDVDMGVVQVTEREKDVLRMVREKNKITRTFSNPVAIPAEGDVTLRTVNLYDNDDYDEERPYPIEIVALTPVASINDAKSANKNLNLNDLSISIIINIQEYYLFFGADTTNAHIAKLNKDTMSAVRFVKIPHHASDTSDKLLDYFYKNQLDFACSTSFHVGNSILPKKEVLDLYKDASLRVDVIGCPTNDTREGIWGEVGYMFKPGSRSMLSEVKTEGVTEQVK